MIRPIKTLLEIAEEFNDTKELADALRELSKDDTMGQASIYYLMESATHLDALYSSYLEVVRALKAYDTEPKKQDAASITIRSDVCFKHVENWTAIDFIRFQYLSDIPCNSKYKPGTVGRECEVLSTHFGVPANMANKIGRELRKTFPNVFHDLLLELTGKYLKGQPI